MDTDDFEMIAIDQGDGTQKQVQALSGRSVKKVIGKIIARAREKGVDMKNWICSSAEKGGFDLCSKLNTPIGELMRQLDDYLKKRWADGALTIASVLAIAWQILLWALFYTPYSVPSGLLTKLSSSFAIVHDNSEKQHGS